MDKVIQIANICKDMCNVPNPIPGRIYYAKGCAPALNTCGGGVENTYVFMDKTKKRYALGRTNGGGQEQRREWHIILSCQSVLRMCYRNEI